MMKIYIKPTVKGWMLLSKRNPSIYEHFETPQQAVEAARELLPSDDSEIVVLTENRSGRRERMRNTNNLYV